MLALACLLHSFVKDYQSQALRPEIPSERNLGKDRINCLVAKNQSLADYKRNIAPSSALFVTLFFVWWLNLLVLLVQFCPHGESSSSSSWVIFRFLEKMRKLCSFSIWFLIFLADQMDQLVQHFRVALRRWMRSRFVFISTLEGPE